MKLVRNNPFLPYSLIVSQNDFKLIQDTEFKAALSPIIPIIEREGLEKTLNMNIRSRNNIHSIDEFTFLIAFDDRVLNKNYLKEICDGISTKIDKNNEIIENAQEALKNIEFNILKVESFSYTKEGVNRLIHEIKSISEELDENTVKITDSEARMTLIKKNDITVLSLQSSLENAKDRFKRKMEDIQSFIGKCGMYSQNLKNKSIKEESLENAKINLEAFENAISKTRDNISHMSLKTANMASILEKERLNYQKYSDAKTAGFIDEDIEKLESKLAVYTSEIGSKIQTLRGILEDYRHQRNEKQKIIDDYNIEEHLYVGKEFSEFEYEGIEQELNEINKSIAQLYEHKNGIQFKVAERNSDLRYMKKNILERCGYEEPKQKENIRDMDFDKEKNLLKKG